MTFEAQITQAFETLTARLRGDIDLQVQRTSAELLAAAPDNRARAPFDVPSTTGGTAPVVAAFREPLVAAVRSIERARSLTEILDTLENCARTEAARADVWLIRGGRLHQWRSPGSEDGADDVPARPLNEGSVIAEAARTNAVAASDGTVAVPIAIAGQVVAILSADLREPETGNDEPGTANHERTLNLDPRTSNLELLTRYAARSLEAMTAFKTARALTQRLGEGVAGSPSAGDETTAEEDTSARRYARLLVSEIKLYHESAVVDGRRDRDLATRLGGEIARARVMYEQRVPAHVRQRADCFQDELVRTLADGDSSLLELRTEN